MSSVSTMQPSWKQFDLETLSDHQLTSQIDSSIPQNAVWENAVVDKEMRRSMD